jgi:hypothetical protein
MRLPESVIGAMKGIGGAALIAAAVAGCGASQPPMKPTIQAPVVLAHQNPQPTPQPTPVVNPQPEPIQPPDDMAIACGRG